MDPTVIPAPRPLAEMPPAPAPHRQEQPLPVPLRVLRALASLRITVVLFALCMLLVLYGTLAQRENGLWTVVTNYFRSLIVWVPLNIFLLNVNHLNKLFEPELTAPLFEIPGSVPFPGGRLLGFALIINLLAAHIVRFRYLFRHAGILLIHAGILVMAAGELSYQMLSVEGLMPIEEGQSANYVVHTDKAELVFERALDPKTDEVIAVPASFLKPGTTVDDARLPVLVKVEDYMTNSSIPEKEPDQNNKATRGTGLQVQAVPRAEVSGVTSETRDTPSAYVTLLDRATKQPLGTYLTSVLIDPDWIKAGDTAYRVSLREQRTYRPFTMYLEKFDYKKFVGTETPKDFRSHIRLVNKTKTPEEDRRLEIYMNAPLRYEGETFYQSQVLQDANKRVKGTVLQVVRNPGWTLPYLSCLMVSLGMLVHFGAHLTSFIEKQTGVRRGNWLIRILGGRASS